MPEPLEVNYAERQMRPTLVVPGDRGIRREVWSVPDEVFSLLLLRCSIIERLVMDLRHLVTKLGS